MANILASSIKNKPHLSVFDEMMDERFKAIDLSPLIINMIDTIAENALPALLSQFNVLGFKGSRFTTTADQKRALLNQAIELHKFKGTAWSIKQALKFVGVTDCDFITGTFVFAHDGQKLRNGTNGYTQSTWASFSLKILSSTFGVLTPEIESNIIAIVNEYKPARCKLVSVIFTAVLRDATCFHDGVKLHGFDPTI